MPLGFGTLGSTAIGAGAYTDAPPPVVIDPPTPTVTGVVVTPDTAVIIAGTTQQFNATVQGTNSPSQVVTWTTTKGQISSTGLVTPPAAMSIEQTGTVTATSVINPLKKGTATFIIPAVVAQPGDIIVAPSRILRTKAGNHMLRDGEYPTEGDTFFLNQGRWFILKDENESLYYAWDIEPDLMAAQTDIVEVEGVVEGATLDMGPIAQGTVLIARVSGGDSSMNYDTMNLLTFRVTCTNGEVFDRTIYFGIRPK